MDHAVGLAVRCLGGLNIWRDGTAVTGFASRKAEALLVYLACNPHTHPRETLATLLWPDNDQTRALANLSVILTSLRKQLDDYLIVERYSVTFNSEVDFQLDVAQFETAVSLVQTQQLGKLTRTGAAQLQTAVALYQGDFLAGFNIPAAPEFEAWVLLEQERLRQQMVNALANLITFYQQRRQFSTAIRYAQQLLALDSLQEEIQRQLMQLYSLDNQRPAALAQYQQYAAVLAEELGVAPDEETTALYEQIKADKVTSQQNVTMSPGHLVTKSPLHNLPAATTTFIGRETEIAHIESWLMEPNGRLLTVIGPGGIGKTRLVQEAARASLGQFADGVWYVSLVPLQSSSELVTAVAETIGLTFTGNTNPAHQLVSKLAGKEMLLILDNFEHLITESSLGLLADIMRQGAELKLLITSRERLNLQAERLLAVTGLSFPEIGEQNTDHSWLINFPAVQLFNNRATRLNADFVLDGQETAVIRLCQLVDGLPLAIELAATWSRTLAASEMVAEIERGIDFLATNWRDMPERHRSVRAVFAYSWEQLTPLEKEVFSRLSVCRGGFTREAAQEISGASLAVLRSLADKSFIRLDAPMGDLPARYRRHPLLIQFAAEQLAQQPEKLIDSQQRLAVFMAKTLDNKAKHFFGPERRSAMAFMTAEHENVRSAWQWAIVHDPALLEKLAFSYQHYLVGAGLFAEGELQFRQALEGLTPPEFSLLRAQIQAQLCQFARFVGQTEEARTLVLDSLAILDRVPTTDKSAKIEALALKQYGGLILSDDSNYLEAKKILEQALVLFQGLNDLVAQGDVLFMLSFNTYYIGQYHEAIRLAERCLTIQQQVQNQIGQMLAQQVLGLVYTSLGSFSQAIDLFHSCIALAEAANYKVDLPWHHADLGYAYLLAGQFAAADEMLAKSLQYSLESGDPQAISIANTLVGIGHLHNGRFADAQSHGQQGLRFSQTPNLNFPFQQAIALNLLGATALALQRYREAADSLAESTRLFREIDHPEYLGWSLPMQLMATCALGRLRRAGKLVWETAVLAQQLDVHMPKLLSLTALAVWCCQQNQPETGLALWTQAEQAPLVARSHWFQRIAQQFIQPEIMRLKPEEMAQAQARGRSLKFDQWLELFIATYHSQE